MANGPDLSNDDLSKAIERIKAGVLKKEESMLHYRRPPKIRPDLKEIVEEEISEEYVD